MQPKQLFIIIGSVLALFGFLLGTYMLTSTPKETFFESLKTIKKSDHSKWASGKKIVMEYSDFQCPACGSYYSILKTFEEDPANADLMKEFTFVYRNFPLDQIHPNAREAAYAAEAAALQNKFFPFHDVLFEKQGEWSELGDPSALFETYAKDLTLDIEKFKSDYSSDAVKEKVQNDYLSGIEASVQGTPSFFIDGATIKSPQSADQFREALLNVLDKKS